MLLKKNRKEKIWTKDKIYTELKNILKKKGYWPSGAELDADGKSDLRGAIQRNGGQIFFWRKLGRPKHKDRLIIDPYKYNSKKKVLDGFKKIKSKIGRFPSYNDLVYLNESALWTQKSKYFKNIEKLYEALGEETSFKNVFVTASGKYVKSQYELIFDNILNFYQLEYDYESLISLETKKKYKYDFKLKDLNQKDIYVEIWGYNEKHLTDRAIVYNKKRIQKKKIYKDLNLKLIEIDAHKLLNGSLNFAYNNISKIFIKNNIIKAIKPINKFQSINLLNAKLYDEESLKKDIFKVVKHYGHLPAYGNLTEKKFIGLRDRFMKVGGFPYLRKKYNVDRPKNKIKWSKEKVKNQIIELVKKYNKMPSYAEFEKEKKMGLFSAMYNHFGGSRKCALELNLKHGFIGSYKDFENFEDIKNAVTKLLVNDKIPSIKVIGNKGPNGLRTVIENMGLHNLAIKMDKELEFHQFKHKNYLLWYIKRHSLKLGFLPSSANIRAGKYEGFPQHMRSYISKLGGNSKVAELLKIKEEK